MVKNNTTKVYKQITDLRNGAAFAHKASSPPITADLQTDHWRQVAAIPSCLWEVERETGRKGKINE